jgi:hypothetical protein
METVYILTAHGPYDRAEPVICATFHDAIEFAASNLFDKGPFVITSMSSFHDDFHLAYADQTLGAIQVTITLANIYTKNAV